MAMAGMRTRKSHGCQKKKPDRSAWPRSKKPLMKKVRPAAQREKDDQEHGGDRGREVGGEFPPEDEQGRAHGQFSGPFVIWRNTSSRLARLTNISATAMSERPRMPASSAAVGRLCGAWTMSRVTPLTRSAT